MKQFSLVFLFLSLILPVSGQQKPALDFSVYDSWKSISGQSISKNGQLISYEINPSEGDGILYLYKQNGQKLAQFDRGDGAILSSNNDYLIFKIVPQADSVRKAKIDKVKKEKMPKDTLVLYRVDNGQTTRWENLKSFKVQQQGPTVLAYMLEEMEKKDVEKADSTSAKSEEGKEAEGKEAEGKEAEGKEAKGKEAKGKEKKKEYNGSDLSVLFAGQDKELKFEHVTDYTFASKGAVLFVTAIEEDSINTSSIQRINTETGIAETLWKKEGVTRQVSLSETGDQLVFLHSTDTTKNKVFSLYHWTAKKNTVVLLVDTLTPGMPEGWAVAESGLRFSKDGKKLFLNTREKPENKKEEKDTLLADDKVFLDIWNWKDPVVQSIQVKRASREKNKSYQAVYLLDKKTLIQLEQTEGISGFRFAEFGNTMIALGLDQTPYEWSNDVNFEDYKDVYLLDLKKNERKLVFSEVEFDPALSPSGQYLYWWEPKDSNYYTYHIAEERLSCLTVGLPVSFAIDNHDYPSDAGSWGSMGWTKDDESVYLYDKHDVWKFDPGMRVDPVCVTHEYGKNHGLRLRYARVDREEDFLDESKLYYFHGFNYETKQSGYFRMSLDAGQPKELILGNYSYRLIARAEDSSELIWSRSSVSEYPELQISSEDFTNSRVLSATNPQQANYNWLSVELVEWRDFNGARHQGLLYKPEDFDPAKSYPMMVYFYRLHSDDLHSYISPRASYSTINAAFYASNGYLVFMPDVFFSIGEPGKSSFNSVVSGVMALGKERSYIDMDHLGIQGQSWGGYQAAYIITQTDLFAAASPGAPVSNMTSAYGGIRQESGMIRQSQYETGQSRIGGSLWEKPLEYFENSPLFFADHCNTPCLIRHNDGDGAVPFEQGVEFFVALRRLGKPAWLLNYNDSPHNLTKKLSNRKDLSVRMKQFFDHYLKEEPAPDWMTIGVKAVDKEKTETYYMQFTK